MAEKPNRNDPCHCGSGSKYKNCCQDKDGSNLKSKLGLVGVMVAIIITIVIALGFFFSLGEGRPDCPPGTTWSTAHQHCH